MTTLGFKKSYAAGEFTETALASLFATIKTYLINSGFVAITNTDTEIDFIKAGHASPQAHDDLPHWNIRNSGIALIPAAVYGASREAAGGFI